MALPETAAPLVVGVWRLNDYLRRKLAADPNLKRVSVRGEITNFSLRGYCNFDLKEADAARLAEDDSLLLKADALLKCFASPNAAATFPALGNGSVVVATGAVVAYPLRSCYQLVVDTVEPDGVGSITLFEQRKRKFTAEGLFALERKKKFPPYPFRIALVSSRTANGAIDFTTILRERAPHVTVVWCETSVQGARAPGEIAAALRRASRADVDAIVVTRGGGSFEDLFVFSDEQVVRAVVEARHPVLSAIGHTADQQLCDFAADGHVETPSAAAKKIAPATLEVRAQVAERIERGRRAANLRLERLGSRLDSALLRSRLATPNTFFTTFAQRVGDADRRLEKLARERLREPEERIRNAVRRLGAHDPSARLANRAAHLQALVVRLDRVGAARQAVNGRRTADAAARLGPAIRMLHERATRRFEVASAHLAGKDPAAILQRGYAIVTYGDQIVRDPRAVPRGALVVARVARGTIAARVETSTADGN